MNYFITGGTGFIGTHLTNLLQELHPECNVYNLDIVEPGTPLPSVEDYKPALRKGQKLASTFIRCDVRKPIVLEGVNVTADDVIFNFAAVHRTPGHPDYAYFETNVLGAENVTAFAEKYGIKKIVFTSSIAPYGAAEELKEETTVPTPNTPYGISKLVAEKIHMIWQARNQAERQLTIVRPGVVFGKGENGNFTRLYWGIRGGNLSQGQKQLLCIARVMLTKPPMLILDEATSSIDTRTELRIQKAFEKMMQGRTSFIVAHRLSTIVNADTILVMNQGKIIEQGNHWELLKKNGFYAKLYNSQFAGQAESSG